MAKSNISSFWLKRIVLMLGVIAAAVAFLLFIPEPGETAGQAAETEKPKKSVSDNLTRFYETFKQISRDPIKERYGDYVLILDNQDEPIGEAIQNITTKNHPPMKNWEGQYKERPFAKGSTLMNEANQFVTKEGLNFIWDLKQDFVIRDRFITNNTLVGMLEDLRGAIDANFDQPILVYFCFKKRVLVITERKSEYLVNNCEKSQGSYSQYY